MSVLQQKTKISKLLWTVIYLYILIFHRIAVFIFYLSKILWTMENNVKKYINYNVYFDNYYTFTMENIPKNQTNMYTRNCSKKSPNNVTLFNDKDFLKKTTTSSEYCLAKIITVFATCRRDNKIVTFIYTRRKLIPHLK